MSAQLDIFEENKILILEEEVKKNKELSEKTFDRSENVRRGVFARLNEHEKNWLEQFVELRKEIDYLKEIIKCAQNVT